ncbi:GTPase, partial [Patulibacter sp. S7RM1-6]
MRLLTATPPRRSGTPGRPSAVEGAAPAAILVGAESSGKSTLATALTGAPAEAANVRGTTVGVERYRGPDGTVVDTPGLTVEGDSEATRRTATALGGEEAVVAVVRASSLDADLAQLLPAVAGRRACVVVTHRDRLPDGVPPGVRRALERDLGVPVVPVDARQVDADDRERTWAAVR